MIMKRALLAMAVALLSGAGALAVSPTAPDFLERLKAISDDEQAFVDAARRFHMEQWELWKMDALQRDSLAQSGQKSESEEKVRLMRSRSDRIGQAYDLVLAQYSENARAWNYFGEWLYDMRGDYAGAERAWIKSETLDPKYAGPMNNLGMHYCHYGEYRKGFRYLDKAVKLEPKNPDFLFNLAQVYLVHREALSEAFKFDKKRLYHEAMSLSERAAKAGPDDYTLAQDYATNFYAAEQFGVEADWKKAANAWAKARPLARNRTERFYTWLNEGRAWLRKPDNEQAATCFEEALKLDNNNEVARTLLKKARGEGDGKVDRAKVGKTAEE